MRSSRARAGPHRLPVLPLDGPGDTDPFVIYCATHPAFTQHKLQVLAGRYLQHSCRNAGFFIIALFESGAYETL